MKFYLLLSIISLILNPIISKPNTIDSLETRKKVAESVKILQKIREEGSFFDGDIIKKYDTIFPIIEKIQKEKGRLKIDEEYLRSIWNNLIDEYGDITMGDYTEIHDKSIINDRHILKEVESAYKIKNMMKWGDSIPQNLFNEYILPYRVGKERIDTNWREKLFSDYSSKIFKEVKKSDMLSYVDKLQYRLSRDFVNHGVLWEYPFDIPISKMQQGHLGSCRHLVNYTTSVMRANGIPATSDFTLLWGNGRTGHMWNVIFDLDGKARPFDAAHYPMSLDLNERKVCKIYRQRTSLNPNFEYPEKEDVPEELYSPYWEDVTNEYIQTFDIEIPIPSDISKIRKYILIGTFDNTTWAPQYYGKINRNKVKYNKIAKDCIYIIMYLDKDNSLKTYGNPFTIDSFGSLKYIEPTSICEDFKLTRKYHETSYVKIYMASMVNCQFSGANHADFRDEKNIFSIQAPSSNITTQEIKAEKFRYIKITNPNKKPAYIAEVIFWNNQQKVNAIPDKDQKNTCDGDFNSYYGLGTNNSIIYDLGESKVIHRIEYAPRSDTNFIMEGDTYELCYWKNDNWVSLGKKVSDGQQLYYENIPAGGLYLLHNLTRGKEERIFKYENNKQIFY